MEPFLSSLIDSYRSYFDIEVRNEGTLRCIATYNSRTEGYVLTKRANLWSMRDDEYVMFHTVDVLTDDVLDTIISNDLAYSDSVIVPDRDHRSSTVTSILICGYAEPKCVRTVERYRYHRNYRFMLRGWMDHRIVLLSLDDGHGTSNRLGREPLENALDILRKVHG